MDGSTPNYEPEGREFECLQARHSKQRSYLPQPRPPRETERETVREGSSALVPPVSAARVLSGHTPNACGQVGKHCRRACGRPHCRCASGRPQDPHPQWALLLVREGKPRLIHLPAALAEEARRGVQFDRRFQELEARILQINLLRLLRKKQALRDQDAAL